MTVPNDPDPQGTPCVPTHAEALATRRRRLLYRSRLRGTHENDLLLGRFATEMVPAMDAPAMDAWEAVLELPDVDIFDWISGRHPVPAEHDTGMLRRLIAHANRRPA